MEIGRHDIERMAEATVIIETLRQIVATLSIEDAEAMRSRVSTNSEEILNRPGIWGPGKDRASAVIGTIFNRPSAGT